MGAALNELLPRKARLVLYVLVAVGSLGLAAWQAAEGDWVLFAAAVVAAFQGSLAAGNVTPEELPENDA